VNKDNPVAHSPGSMLCVYCVLYMPLIVRTVMALIVAGDDTCRTDWNDRNPFLLWFSITRGGLFLIDSVVSLFTSPYCKSPRGRVRAPPRAPDRPDIEEGAEGH
jgi:hypothetical protein